MENTWKTLVARTAFQTNYPQVLKTEPYKFVDHLNPEFIWKLSHMKKYN